MNEDLRIAREKAAAAIFVSGSFKIDLKEGFLIALHEDLPEAPRSPFYLNLRPKGVKGGTLEQKDIWSISKAMLLLDDSDKRLFHAGRPVCSIPAAGNPFLNAILDEVAINRSGKDMPQRFTLEKNLIRGKHVFELSVDDDFKWNDVLLIDDLVTSMKTKLAALKPIQRNSGTVTDLLVFLNRSTDATQKLAERGVKLHAVWEFEQLMEWALGRGYLTRHQYETIVWYPEKLQAYKASVGYQD